MARRTRKEILEDRLTQTQIKAVYMLLDNELKPKAEQLSQEEIAKQLGINRATLYRWRTQNQDFIDYRREVTKNYISDMSGLFLKSLRKAIEGNNGMPSMKALDLFAKVEGFIQTANQLDVNINSGARTNEDIEQELAELEKQLAEMETEEDK